MAVEAPCLSPPAARRRLSAHSGTAVAVAGCMVLALVLRWLMVRNSGIWADEGQFLWVVRIPSLGAMIEFLQVHESHPPLFYLIMRAWFAFVGDSEAAALALPIALGVALVPAVYFVGERTFDRMTGLIAAALVALSPSLGLHSGLARPYTLLPLLCVLSVFTLWRGLCGGGTRWWIAHAAATLAMLLTHHWAWMVAGAQWLVAGAWLVAHCRGPERRLVPGWTLTQIAIGAGYAPWLTTLLYQARHAGHGPAPVSPVDALTFFAAATISLPLLPAVSLGLACIVIALWRATACKGPNPGDSEPRSLALLLFVAIPLVAFGAAAVLSSSSFLLLPRCLTTSAPCLLIAIAHLITTAPTVPRGVILGSLLIGYLVASVALFGHVKSNAREVAPMIAAQAHATDLIIVEPKSYVSSFDYYYNKPSERLALFPSRVQAGAVHCDHFEAESQNSEAPSRLEAQMERAHEQGRRIWLVTERKVLSDPSASGDGSRPVPGSNPAYRRTNQIRRRLDVLYGKPDTSAVTVDDREGWEIFRVFLYVRNDPEVNQRPDARLGTLVAP